MSYYVGQAQTARCAHGARRAQSVRPAAPENISPCSSDTDDASFTTCRTANLHWHETHRDHSSR